MQLLGLHGYYLVTSVASTITDTSFNTSITALHEGVKFAQNTLLLPESYGNLPAEKIPEGYWDPDTPPKEAQERDISQDDATDVAGALARGDIGQTEAALRTAATLLGGGKKKTGAEMNKSGAFDKYGKPGSKQ